MAVLLFLYLFIALGLWPGFYYTTAGDAAAASIHFQLEYESNNKKSIQIVLSEWG